MQCARRACSAQLVELFECQAELVVFHKRVPQRLVVGARLEGDSFGGFLEQNGLTPWSPLVLWQIVCDIREVIVCEYPYLLKFCTACHSIN